MHVGRPASPWAFAVRMSARSCSLPWHPPSARPRCAPPTRMAPPPPVQACGSRSSSSSRLHVCRAHLRWQRWLQAPHGGGGAAGTWRVGRHTRGRGCKGGEGLVGASEEGTTWERLARWAGLACCAKCMHVRLCACVSVRVCVCVNVGIQLCVHAAFCALGCVHARLAPAHQPGAKSMRVFSAARRHTPNISRAGKTALSCVCLLNFRQGGCATLPLLWRLRCLHVFVLTSDWLGGQTNPGRRGCASILACQRSHTIRSYTRVILHSTCPHSMRVLPVACLARSACRA